MWFIIYFSLIDSIVMILETNYIFLSDLTSFFSNLAFKIIYLEINLKLLNHYVGANYNYCHRIDQ